MKYTLLQIGGLTVVVALLLLFAHGPVESRWGADGVRSLRGASVLCWAAALLAAIPAGLATAYWRQFAPQVALAGTVVRLLVTGALALAYYVFGDIHLESFLACVLANYLALLLAETVFIVYMVRVVFVDQSKDTQ